MVVRAALFLCLAAALHAQKFYTYVGQITSRTALIAWGTTEGHGNTIGRNSSSFGKATVKIGNGTITSEQNWVLIKELQPDTEYPYEVLLYDKKIGGGKVRTYPERANRLVFFVIGDYGIGNSKQARVADAMWKEFQRREASGNPVRFVLTTGDNIYSDVNLVISKNSGDDDSHWQEKFFRPYEPLLKEVPFYPTLGNHDGNASENRGDLTVYLDNFFFPGETPARYYHFTFGGLAEFFALDTTDNTATGPPAPAYGPESPQFTSITEWMTASRAPWKIPYFHNPPFNAGPRHGASYDALKHFVRLFQKTGVRVVFTGHEHNFQFSERNEATGGVLYVISGAGGELRSGDIMKKLLPGNMAGWAAQRHFLVVEIADKEMRITPLSYERIVVHDKNGREVPMPIVATLP